MADQQIYTRGVRRSATPTVRLVLPTTRSAAVANDLLQNLILDQAPMQARPAQQMRPMQQSQRPQQTSRPPQFAQRSTPQQAPNSLRLEGQGVMDQIRNLLILQRGLSPDAADGELVNEQGGQGGRDAAGSMMGRTDNEGTAVGKYGTAAARTLGNMALSATLGPLGPAMLGFATRNLTNDNPADVAADGITRVARTAVTNAVPGLGLARTLMGLFRLPDPVVEVEKAVKPVVKKVLDQLTNPPALPAAGEGSIDANTEAGYFGINPENADIGRATNSWGGVTNQSPGPQTDSVGESLGGGVSRNPAATNTGWRGWAGLDGDSDSGSSSSGGGGFGGGFGGNRGWSGGSSGPGGAGSGEQ